MCETHEEDITSFTGSLTKNMKFREHKLIPALTENNNPWIKFIDSYRRKRGAKFEPISTRDWWNFILF